MHDIKCKDGVCIDVSAEKKMRKLCDKDDIACEIEADLIEKQTEEEK